MHVLQNVMCKTFKLILAWDRVISGVCLCVCTLNGKWLQAVNTKFGCWYIYGSR